MLLHGFLTSSKLPSLLFCKEITSLVQLISNKGRKYFRPKKLYLCHSLPVLLLPMLPIMPPELSAMFPVRSETSTLYFRKDWGSLSSDHDNFFFFFENVNIATFVHKLNKTAFISVSQFNTF